ncbi:MAG: 30S ribosomal protein S5 [Candidatus Coatesbacteria bacterium]|nr:30S ribosomal protein S5 [Candidatus Coatesbacteria bacterium]
MSELEHNIGEEHQVDQELEKRIISINRVAKVVKGGRRLSASVLMAVGDKNSRIGIGLGKARAVPDAIRKAIEDAKKNMITIEIRDTTIPIEVMGQYGSSKVLLKPAGRGTGVIAGGTVRAILEAAGIGDVLTKSIGTTTPHNLAKATMEGLKKINIMVRVSRYRRRRASGQVKANPD